MPDLKISALPAVVTVATGDLGVVVATGVTSKITQQQQINALVSFITAIVNIGGGKITLNPAGNISVASGMFTVDAAGNVSVNGTTNLNFDGTGFTAAGHFHWDINGKITTYANIVTAGLGMPPIVASTNLPTFSTSHGPTLLFTATTRGLFRISGYLEVLTPDVSGTIDVALNYTDENGPQTIDLSGTQILTLAGSFPCSGQTPGNNVFVVDAGQTVSYTATIAGDTGNSSSNLYLVLEQLQST